MRILMNGLVSSFLLNILLLYFLVTRFNLSAASEVEVSNEGPPVGQGIDSSNDSENLMGPSNMPLEEYRTAILEKVDELMKILLPGSKIRITHSLWIDSLSPNALAAGKEHELLLLVRNDWALDITLLFVVPSFRDPNNMDVVLRNITANRVFVNIPAGNEATLSYRLKLDTDPTTVGLNIVIDYTDNKQSRWYKAEGYSEVIHIIDANKTKIQTAFMYTIIIILGSASLMLVQKIFFKYKSSK